MGYETLWDGSPMHVESARISIGFKKKMIVKLSEALKNLTGLTTACMIQEREK